MIIFLSPQVPVETPHRMVLTRSADTVAINGTRFDFAQLQDGHRLPAAAVDHPFVIDDVIRQNGELRLTLLLQIAADAPEEARFPEPVKAPSHGTVSLPDIGTANDPIIVESDGSIDWSAVQAPPPPPPPPVVTVPVDVFFNRTTVDEADAIDAAMQRQPVKHRRAYNAATSFRSDSDLWPVLRNVIVDLYGAERADQLLATPNEVGMAAMADAESV